MRGHTRTDPACAQHRAPRGPISRWWFDRRRGIPCRACLPGDLYVDADELAAAQREAMRDAARDLGMAKR